MLWVVGGLFIAFMLYLLVDAWVAARKRRKQAALLSGEEEHQEQAKFDVPPEEQWSDFVAATCDHCQKTLYVPKMRRFKPFICPHCQVVNPPIKKDALAPVKKFLRWLLYPSFQDRF
jgi:phage FluMu protein Com